MGSGILLGLAAALCWGIADFCARGATRSAGTFRTLLVLNAIASVALLAIAAPFGLLAVAGASTGALLAAAAVNLLILFGAALLYRAFAIGTLALMSPIAASFAAITALLAILTGEHPTVAQLAGIVVTLAGVILTSTVPGHPSVSKRRVRVGPFQVAPGLIEALASMLVFGVTYWALRFVVADLGGVLTAFIGKVSDLAALSVIGLVALVISRHRSATPPASSTPHPLAPNRRFLVYVVPTALLDTTANIAYNLGIATALQSVVVVLSSLFSAVTVLLAWLFLRDRLTRWQWTGVAAILVGIALVSI